jgi:hypothetical protein
MQLRNIGIVGYAGVFPVAALLLAILFQRTPPITPGQQTLGKGRDAWFQRTACGSR